VIRIDTILGCSIDADCSCKCSGSGCVCGWSSLIRQNLGPARMKRENSLASQTPMYFGDYDFYHVILYINDGYVDDDEITVPLKFVPLENLCCAMKYSFCYSESDGLICDLGPCADNGDCDGGSECKSSLQQEKAESAIMNYHKENDVSLSPALLGGVIGGCVGLVVMVIVVGVVIYKKVYLVKIKEDTITMLQVPLNE